MALLTPFAPICPQVGLLGAFVSDAATQSVVGWPLPVGALVVGLIGGTIYVQVPLLPLTASDCS